MKVTVVVHPSEHGYWVEVPSLPGCVSQGDNIPEALENVREAIQGVLQFDLDDVVISANDTVLEIDV
jgi:predicted RNase H-like HicB family nuclease